MGTHDRERTSHHVASIAAKALKDPKSVTLKQVKTLAGSALTQAPDHRKPSQPRRGR